MKKRSSVYIHPNALVESDRIGKGTRVWAFAHIMKGAQVGERCNVCNHCFIEEGARIGNHVTVKNGVSIWNRVEVEDNVFLGPNMVFTNDLNPRAEIKKAVAELTPTLVRQGASIGANATILCGITIGRYGFVAAGAVVTRSVPDFALLAGVPARRQGWMCWCGSRIHRSGSRFRCKACGQRFRLTADGLAEIPPISLRMH